MNVFLLMRQLLVAICFIVITVSAAKAQDSGPPLQVPQQVTSPSIDSEELQLRLSPLTKAELEVAAIAWLDIAKAKATEVVDAMVSLKAAEGEAAGRLRERVVALTAERNSMLDNLALVADAWEAKGGQAEAVADIRAYRNSMRVDEV